MDYVTILQQLCTMLAQDLNNRDPRPHIQSVTLTSEARRIGVTATDTGPNTPQMAWFVEIKVDGVITHKQVHAFDAVTTAESAEQITAWNLLWEVFATGVMFDKREIDKRKQPADEDRIKKMAKAYATAELTDKEKTVAERAFLMGATYAGSLQGKSQLWKT